METIYTYIYVCGQFSVFLGYFRQYISMLVSTKLVCNFLTIYSTEGGSETDRQADRQAERQRQVATDRQTETDRHTEG